MKVKHVLLVDDEPDIRTVGEMSLRDVGGLDVAVAGSGPEALEMIKQRRPDVVLMDVMMPGMDGPTVLAQLKADPATASIPVIFLTAKVQRSEVDHYIELGAHGVIRKPFDPMTLPQDLQARVADVSA